MKQAYYIGTRSQPLKANKFENEQELAAIVVDRLKAEGWEVFQEVQVFSTVADIVAKKDSKLWIIETKTSLNLDVLGQAYDWRHFADMVSVAVPLSRHSRGRNFAHVVCRQLNIGLITVSSTIGWDNKPHWYIEVPAKDTTNDPILRQRLENSFCDLHKTWSKAGSPAGGHLTNFKLTNLNAIEYVKDNPGCTIKQLVDNIDTHYANKNSAKSSILSALNRGWLKGVTAKQVGKEYKLYIEETNG